MESADFDLSKENVQPLRGGRNIGQLEMALQAQHNRDAQMELLHTKEQFENLIRTYQGADPLENWYNYISWVEQSYPKHGHEGNLVALLEACLGQFEHDKRYSEDRRFCKLWIKYIDLQANPLELYQMMHSRGVCVGSADLYRAWAYYHEAAGDFKSANHVFELGKQALAQPYEELKEAHKNLIVAAGEHIIHGSDHESLRERRAALTSLKASQRGDPGSVRQIASSGAGILPSATNSHKENTQFAIYEEQWGEARGGPAAAPTSILSCVKREEMPKENNLKAGPWGTGPVKKKLAVHHEPGFKVHIDGNESLVEGLVPYNYPKHTEEDLSEFVVSLIMEEPPDDKVRMYPKHKVYCEPHTEYSVEEIRAHRYRSRRRIIPQNSFSMDISQIHDVTHVNNMSIQQMSTLQSTTLPQQSFALVPPQMPQYQSPQHSILQHSHFAPQNVPMPTLSPQLVASPQISKNVPFPIFKDATPQSNRMAPEITSPLPQISPLVTDLAFPIYKDATPEQPPKIRVGVSPQNTKSFRNDAVPPNLGGQGGSSMMNLVWSASGDSPGLAPKNSPLFVEGQFDLQSKGNAMKTPFKTLNADELAETGSRGGMDVAAAAVPPVDGAVIYMDDVDYQDFNNSCNTQMFNFNLNAMKVSTPQGKSQIPSNVNQEAVAFTKKQLFEEEDKTVKDDKGLFTIYEETKSYVTSSSSSASSAKSSLFSNNTKPSTMATTQATISEEHNSYLAQNMMANDDLRRSLLGDLIPNLTSSPRATASPPVHNIQRPISPTFSALEEVEPNVVTPFDWSPSDPFASAHIDALLAKVNFPGPHKSRCYCLGNIPRIYARKDAILIGKERYLVEKQLGKGTYGVVFKATKISDKSAVALKLQKPANKWEFYICRELQARLKDSDLKNRFMNVDTAYFCPQSSLLISNFMPYGSLLDLVNKHKQKTEKPLNQFACMYLCIEMLDIIHAMHKVKIIHADIKPDNFLIQISPDGTRLELHLIDFGCSIDMSLYPENALFTRKVITENFICCEMQDGRQWSYHTDLFCIAATAHVILFDKYINLQKTGEIWSITSKYPRYMKADIWNMFFSSLLNQQNGVDIDTLKYLLDDALQGNMAAINDNMRFLINIAKNR